MFKTAALGFSLGVLTLFSDSGNAPPWSAQHQTVTAALINGSEPGWRALGEEDFTNVNCDSDTWLWKNGLLICTGQPIGVLRTRQMVTNFKLIVDCGILR